MKKTLRTPVISSILFLLSSTLITASCDKTQSFDLKLYEPCDQQDKAFANGKSFRLSYAEEGELNNYGAELDSVAFTKEELSALSFPLDDKEKSLTVQVFDNGTLSGSPIAIGRSLPVSFKDNNALNVSLGTQNSFGKASFIDEQGKSQCSSMGGDGTALNARHGHTSTFLPSLNKVLILGGAVWLDNPNGNSDQPQCEEFEVDGATRIKCFLFLKKAELFDPNTGKHTTLPVPSHGRAYHTATLLPDGRVLFVGGFTFIKNASGTSQLTPMAIGFIFDPAKLTFAEDGSVSGDPYSSPILFNKGRALHTATLVESSNQVVVIGGCGGNGSGLCTPYGVSKGDDPDNTVDPTLQLDSVVQVYDIEKDKVTSPADLSKEDQELLARARHATSIAGNLIIISGGLNAAGNRCNIEVLRSSQGTLKRAPLTADLSNLTICPAGHQQISIDERTIAIIGGASNSENGQINTKEALISKVQFWHTSQGLRPEMAIEMLGGSTSADGNTAVEGTGRLFHKAVKLHDDSILIAGGMTSEGGASAERLVKEGEKYKSIPLNLPLDESRAEGQLTVLPNNQAIFTGGYNAAHLSSSRTDIYFGDCRASGTNPDAKCVR